MPTRSTTTAKRAPAKKAASKKSTTKPRTPRVRKAPAIELGALARNCSGPSVGQLRTALGALGYDVLVADELHDVYEDALDQAVHEFQRAHELPVGLADTTTLEAINKETR